MSTSKFHLFILVALLLVNGKLSLASVDIPVLSIADIKILTKDSCILVSLYGYASPLMESLQYIFKKETKVIIARIRESEKLNLQWSRDNDFTSEKDDNIAFYPEIVKDRSCLMVPTSEKMLAYHVPANLDLKEWVDFLNNKCFTFRGMDGEINREGLQREKLLKDLFSVPKSSKFHLGDSYEAYGDKCDEITIPTQKAFNKKYLQHSKPVIIKNATKAWPAFSRWTNDFLRGKYGDKRVHVKVTSDGEFEGCDAAEKFENYGSFYVPPKVLSQLKYPDLVVVRPAVLDIPFKQFLDMIERKTNVSAYLEYSSLRQYFPELEQDLEEFQFIPGFLKLDQLNIWLSNGNTLGKLHFDPYDNFLCQLSGKKELTLFEPHNNYNLYEAHIQEAVLGYDAANDKLSRRSLLDSTSMVMSPIDIKKPDFARFSNFTRASPLKCVLEEGDVLFMPSFWWHEVQSYPSKTESRNLAVNYWYHPFYSKEFPCPECKLDINKMYRKMLEYL